MGLCVYTPAFALNAGKKSSCILLSPSDFELMRSVVQCVAVFSFFPVTGFELWGAVLATGLVCTLYTTMVS